MIWQDIVITIANAVFSISLIPQVYYGFKEKTAPIRIKTSLPTFLGLSAITFSMWTLGLYLSAVITGITGIMWLLLFIQKLLYKH